MVNGERESATEGASPLAFAVQSGRCFGWFHAARGDRRGTGIVLCRPMGYEAICSYAAYTQIAHLLATLGFDVIRFDYLGVGDSTGDDGDAHQVAGWIDSVQGAAAELRRLASISQLVLFGTRLGAALAVQAALRMNGEVDGLVLWAPCATGRGFVREQRAASAGRLLGKNNLPTTDIEALGHFYSAQTVADLDALDCLNIPAVPARKVLVLGRDDMPHEGPLPGRYRALGADTSYALVGGYASVMAEPREALLPDATLAVLTGWLAQAYPARVARSDVAARGAKAARTAEWMHNGIHETSCRFGAGQLFGILSTPAAIPADEERSETAVVMLNVGGNYHIGPNRMYVRLARSLATHGYSAFRLDLPGIGDSDGGSGFSLGSLYTRDSSEEVRAALDWLESRGCKRFILAGICSGSFVAFQAALADPRVQGQILMNSRQLESDIDGKAAEWQGAMRSYYKSTDFYRRALFRADVYPRLLRGEIDVMGIAHRFVSVIRARATQACKDLLQTSFREDDLLAKVKKLGARGVHTLVVMAAQDDGRDYVEYHFGKCGRRLRGDKHFEMMLVEDSDHTFSGMASQREVIAAVQLHLVNTGPAPTKTTPASDSQAIEELDLPVDGGPVVAKAQVAVSAVAAQVKALSSL
jgi:alpha-beta hydrolase superfamily lysophospholipase